MTSHDHAANRSSMNTRTKLAIASNVFVAIMTAVAWGLMLVGWGSEGQPLSSTGLENLKYFTVLSNVFSGIVSGVFAWNLVRTSGRPKRALCVLKLTATTCVGLTFVTVVGLFCIIFGLGGMFLGANFWFHLVLPLISMIEFCLLDPCVGLTRRSPRKACIPVALYAICYYTNILINGVGEWPDTNDFYGFTSWGMQFAPIVLIIMMLATLLIATILRKINRACNRK